MRNIVNLPDRTLSERLKKLRLENGYTQEKIAEKIGKTAKAYGKYEREDAEPTLDTIIALSYIYGASTDYILLGEENSVSTEFERITKDCSEEFRNHIFAVVQCMVNEFH